MDGTVGSQSSWPLPDSGPGSLRTCRHAAAVVGGDGELVELAVRYVREGLRAGDRTLLCCSPEMAELIGAELGPVAGRVQFDAGLTVPGARPPDVFSGLREHVRRAEGTGSGRVRVVVETGIGCDAEGVREEMRSEAVFNHVMADLPISALCVYDSRRVPAELLASVARTHPQLLSPGGWASSSVFEPATSFLRALPVPRRPEDALRPVFAIDAVPTLPELRHRLGGVLAEYVPDADLRDDLHLGLSEVAANAFRHGTPPVSARMWVDGPRIVCTITDGGREFDDPLAGFVPAHGYDLSQGGMGLWLARKLWDHVDLVSGPHGLTVRLDVLVPPAVAPETSAVRTS